MALPGATYRIGALGAPRALTPSLRCVRDVLLEAGGAAQRNRPLRVQVPWELADRRRVQRV